MEDRQQPSLPKDKQYLHALAGKIPPKNVFSEIKFENLTELLFELGITEDPYSYVNLEGNDQTAISSLIKRSFAVLKDKSETGVVQEQVYRLWDYLADEDELLESDLIFVFGGIELTRMNEGVRLLKLGYAEKILFSGKHPSYMNESDISEAELYAEEARKLGVKEEQLLLETQAINTPENVLNSVALLNSKHYSPKKVIIVTSPYHLRRAYLTCKAVESWKPLLIRHGAPSANHFRELYYKDEHTWALTFLEYLKIYGGRVMKHF